MNGWHREHLRVLDGRRRETALPKGPRRPYPYDLTVWRIRMAVAALVSFLAGVIVGLRWH